MKTATSKLLPLVAAAMLGTLCGPLLAETCNENLTIQEGQHNLNDARQRGDINNNATWQDGRENWNRTRQRGDDNFNASAQFGRNNFNETHQSRGFKRTGYNPARSDHNKPWQHISKRDRDHRNGPKNRDK